MKHLLICFAILVSSQAFASPIFKQSPDKNTLDQMAIHNQQQADVDAYTNAIQGLRNSNVVPFAEYETTGYIFFNDDDYRGYATEIKKTIAQQLPKEAKLVVYTTSRSQNYLKRLENYYKSLIDPNRLVILQVPRSGSNNFWTRDNLPLPVWTEGQLTLVDAKYYYNFEPDAFLTELFGALSTSHRYFFEGGNFIANSRGECIVVNRRKAYVGGVSDTAAIPDAIFKNHYGCQKLTRFKHLKGIGHADEVVKFMSDDIIVTDTPEYVDTLEGLGYQVVLLPEPDLDYETYVNSLQVNNTLFVPIFNEQGDQRAIDTYKNLNLGLKIVPIPTRALATRGQGGIHCITMNYPPAPLQEIIRNTGGTILHQ